jgi:hypothetical protein
MFTTPTHHEVNPKPHLEIVRRYFMSVEDEDAPLADQRGA